jgi:hypothetical protein
MREKQRGGVKSHAIRSSHAPLVKVLYVSIATAFLYAVLPRLVMLPAGTVIEH